MIVSASVATTQHIVWRRDGSSSSWLLHTGGEGAPQRGMEAFWGTEEKLREGEKELHRGCYSPGTRSTWAFLCSTFFYSTCIMGVVIALLFPLNLFAFHRKKPFRRTVLLGSRTNFWTWLPLQTVEGVLRLTDKVLYQLVSLTSKLLNVFLANKVFSFVTGSEYELWKKLGLKWWRHKLGFVRKLQCLNFREKIHLIKSWWIQIACDDI